MPVESVERANNSLAMVNDRESAAAMLRIYLFGTPRAFDGDAALPLPNPPKVLALWAFLLLHRDRAIPRDEVAFALWLDVPEAEARSNLRRHLHLLRHYLPRAPAERPWFFADRETVRWNRAANYWLDVEQFAQTAGSASQIVKDEPAEEAIRRLRCASDYYTGDLLQNLYDDWVLVERERLRYQYLQMLEQLGARQEQVGDLRGAIDTAQRLLAHDRLRETTHRLVMRLRYRAGDRAAALRQFDECRRLLREELNVDPMPDTLELRQAILAGQALAPAPTVPRVPLPTPLAQPPSPISSRASQPPPRLKNTPPLLARWLLLAGILSVLLVAARVILSGMFQPTETVTLSGPGVVQDTWITAEYPDTPFWPVDPSSPFAEYSQVHLQFYDRDLDRFLIHFDLSALPAGSKIERASFLLHLETWTAESGEHALPRAYPATVTAYRMRRAWKTDAATYSSPWSKAGMAVGADYDAEPLATQPISGTAWLTFDITPAVRDWLANPDTNYGLVLMITAAPEGVAHYWVDTTDHSSPTRRPRLIVTYQPGVASDRRVQTLTLTNDDGVDTWITTELSNATSAAGLRGQSADALVWVTGAFDNLPPPAGRDILDIPFDQFPRARLNKAGQTASHALLWFDAARLPANARVERADLNVFLEPARLPEGFRSSGPFPATIAVYRLLRVWQPQTVTFSFPWAEAGLAPRIDYDASPLDTRPLRGATWLTFDVTSAVTTWQRGTNAGLLLVVQEATEGLAPYWLATREFPDPTFRPRLQIRYRPD